jgi:hypothetical protein
MGRLELADKALLVETVGLAQDMAAAVAVLGL